MGELGVHGGQLKHTSWKLHVREFIDGESGLTAAQATGHRDFEFGKWRLSDRRSTYGSIHEMKLLVKERERLHAAVAQRA